MIDTNDGTFYTTEEMQDMISSMTTEQIKELDKHIVEVKGTEEAVSTLAAKLAVSEDNLHRIQNEARQRVYKRMR